MGGKFVFQQQVKYNSHEFAGVIYDWAANTFKRLVKSVYECVPKEKLLARVNSDKPLVLILLGYAFSVNLFGTRVYSNVPDDHFDELKLNLFNKIYALKDVNGNNLFDENDFNLLAHFANKYMGSISKFYSNPRQLSYGPGGDVFDDILEMYDIELESIAVLDRMKAPTLINISLEPIKMIYAAGYVNWEVD